MVRYWSVFSKPWKELPAEALGVHVASLGFDAVEFPLRPGFQAEPDNADRSLPALARVLGRSGIRITSVASVTGERVFAGMQAAGIGLLRIMAMARPGEGYRECACRTKRELESLVPLCEKYGVTVGVQQHVGYGVFTTMEMYDIVRDFDPRYVTAVWDAAHSALAGEIPAQAFDILGEHLGLVNLKSAHWERRDASGAAEASYRPVFTCGTQCAVPWRAAVRALYASGYDGGICMPAEYTDTAGVDGYIREDLAFAKRLFEEERPE